MGQGGEEGVREVAHRHAVEHHAVHAQDDEGPARAAAAAIVEAAQRHTDNKGETDDSKQCGTLLSHKQTRLFSLNPMRRATAQYRNWLNWLSERCTLQYSAALPRAILQWIHGSPVQPCFIHVAHWLLLNILLLQPILDSVPL